jgi:hypothetical protein
VIISHKHKFVFVKTHKTAGTSIEAFLADLAGDDAVVTPVDPPVKGHVARNYKIPDDAWRALLWRVRAHSPVGAKPNPAYWNHISARGIRTQLGRRRFDDYFTFCFERNPWEKVVSGYYFAKGREAFTGEFRDYVKTADLWSDFDIYSIDGTTVGVDFVGRYEHLADDMQKALDRVGLGNHVLSLTREKGNYRPEGATVDSLFDDEMSARVERVFEREIRAFGYTRPPHLGAPSPEPASDSR